MDGDNATDAGNLWRLRNRLRESVEDSGNARDATGVGKKDENANSVDGGGGIAIERFLYISGSEVVYAGIEWSNGSRATLREA